MLAPLLFAFYVADMLKGVSSTKYKFADDATLYTEGESGQEVVDTMQNDVHKINTWTKKWRFKVNCSKQKTELMAINFEPSINQTIYLGSKALEYVGDSKVLGLWIDNELTWNHQVSATTSKLWYQWMNIKKLTHHNRGLKMETVVKLVKIAILPILFYCAPVWLSNKVGKFQDLWYNILKSATGSSFKPDLKKLEIICSLPPLDIQVRAITIKFLIKNLVTHEEDVFTKAINAHDNARRHFVKKHVQYVKQYYAHGADVRSARIIDLETYQNTKYTKTTIWNYVRMEWMQRIRQEYDSEEVFDWQGLIAPKPMKLTLPRKTEVLLFNLLHGHLPSNQFLWKLSQVESPLCACLKEIETPEHMLFHCILNENSRSEQLKDMNGWHLSGWLVKTSDRSKRQLVVTFKQDLKRLLNHILVNRFKNETRVKKYMLQKESDDGNDDN